MSEKELAYRNGYAKGYADAKKNEKHGRWDEPSRHGLDKKYNKLGVICSVCKEWNDWPRPYCPNCGAIMGLPNITENTRKALEKMGENVHSEIDFDYAAED